MSKFVQADYRTLVNLDYVIKVETVLGEPWARATDGKSYQLLTPSDDPRLVWADPRTKLNLDHIVKLKDEPDGMTFAYLADGSTIQMIGEVIPASDISSGVTSFEGRTGAVISAAGDYLASEVINDSTVPGATVAEALDLFVAGIGYTDEMAQDAIAAAFAAGTHTGITVTYDDALNKFSLASTVTQYTNELAQDAAAAALAAGTHTALTFIYDDAGNAISAAVSDILASLSASTTGVGTDPLDLARHFELGPVAYMDRNDILESFGSTQGQVLYRGATAWTALGPGTAGQFLQTNGAAANPSWGSISATLTALVDNTTGVGTDPLDVVQHFQLNTLAYMAIADISIVASQLSDFSEAAQDAIGAMVDTTLVYADATPLLTRAALTGDISAPQGSNVTTLATVNGNVGTFGSAAQSVQLTVNGKGLITAAANAAITPAAIGAAPSTPDYLVRTADAGLSAERVVTDTSTIAWDWATGGQAKAALTGIVPDANLSANLVSLSNSTDGVGGDPMDVVRHFELGGMAYDDLPASLVTLNNSTTGVGTEDLDVVRHVELGALAYMSPEQIVGVNRKPASSIILPANHSLIVARDYTLLADVTLTLGDNAILMVI